MHSRFRPFAGILAASLLAVCAQAGAVDSNSISVQFSLASLPSTITLCRDAGAIQVYGIDEEWVAAIDVDGNAATGDTSRGGVDALLVIATAQQSYPCSPTSASTASSLGAQLAVWDNTQQAYLPSAVSASVAVDLAAKTLTVSAPISGPLAKLSASSKVYVAAEAPYTNGAMGVQVAYDNTPALSPPTTVSDPAGDVQGCSGTCTPGASWYGLIDLVGVTLDTSQPLPMFGANTVYAEFDVASLPVSMSLCRFPETDSFADSSWTAFIDVDGNPNNGYQGIDAIVEVYTVLQQPTCAPNSLPLDQALQADAAHWDDGLQNFVQDTTLTAYADAATGKIFVQADRSAAPLVGLSAKSVVVLQSVGAYPMGMPGIPGAYDQVGPLPFGVQATAPSGNVQDCTSPCSPGAGWYGQIDLVGGSLHLQDEVFGGDFE